MKAWGSAAAVIAALADEAAAERERLERESAAAIVALNRDAAARPDGGGARSAAEDRLDAVGRAVVEADAAEDWDDTVAAASDRDAWIAAVAAEGRRAIASGAHAQEWLARVTREAVAELPGGACTVTVPAAMLEGADAWRPAVERETARTITLEAGALTAGCIARTPDGRVAFDNTVEARERRSRTEWRSAVARIHDAALSGAPTHAEVA